MNDQTINAADSNLRPMRYGRAMHMDLSRASDLDLDRAFRVLDDYDTAGKASDYTREDIDDRIAAIFDEQDRRAGQEPVYVPRQPTQRELHEARQRVEAAESIGEEDDDADDVLSRDIASPAPLERLRHHVTGAIERGEAEPITEVPVTTLLDTPTPAEREQVEDDARETFENEQRAFDETGLVPGETSAM